ncbi:MAG: stage II sporulation protein M [Candidatus Bathyarchaeia archaeon]
MRHCPKCGVPTPEDKEAKFCPNCGTYLSPSNFYEERMTVGIAFSEERKAVPLKRRIAVFSIVFILCLAMTSLGAMSKLDPSVAQDIKKDLDKQSEALEIVGVPLIFGNNLMHTMIMFVPGFGPFWGLLVLYNTGTVIAAVSTVANPPMNPLMLFASLFITPFAWMEYVSYSLAISESIWLIYATVKRRFKGLRDELATASKLIAICAVVLLLAAIIEMVFISSV